MALRDTMRESVTAYLEPGETVQYVIGAQTRSNFLMLTGVFYFFNRSSCLPKWELSQEVSRLSCLETSPGRPSTLCLLNWDSRPFHDRKVETRSEQEGAGDGLPARA